MDTTEDLAAWEENNGESGGYLVSVTYVECETTAFQFPGDPVLSGMPNRYTIADEDETHGVSIYHQWEKANEVDSWDLMYLKDTGSKNRALSCAMFHYDREALKAYTVENA